MTGVFITQSDFQVIELEYMAYLEENHLSDGEAAAERFYREWREEQEVLGTFVETVDGNLKYYCMDGDDGSKITALEYLDICDKNSYSWEKKCRTCWKVFEEMAETRRVQKDVVANILAERQISYDQIYQLMSAMITKFTELNARE